MTRVNLLTPLVPCPYRDRRGPLFTLDLGVTCLCIILVKYRGATPLTGWYRKVGPWRML